MTIVRNQAFTKPFVEVSKLPIEQQLALEDDNVRQSLRYARERLEG